MVFVGVVRWLFVFIGLSRTRFSFIGIDRVHRNSGDASIQLAASAGPVVAVAFEEQTVELGSVFGWKSFVSNSPLVGNDHRLRLTAD